MDLAPGLTPRDLFQSRRPSGSHFDSGNPHHDGKNALNQGIPPRQTFSTNIYTMDLGSHNLYLGTRYQETDYEELQQAIGRPFPCSPFKSRAFVCLGLLHLESFPPLLPLPWHGHPQFRIISEVFVGLRLWVCNLACSICADSFSHLCLRQWRALGKARSSVKRYQMVFRF